MNDVLYFILLILRVYWYIIIVAVVFSWLISFNIVNPRNRFIGLICEFLYRATEPTFSLARRILPNTGPVDFSPLIVMMVIYFLQEGIIRFVAPALLS